MSEEAPRRSQAIPGAQNGMPDLDLRGLVEHIALVVETLPGIVGRLDGGHADDGVLAGEHAQRRTDGADSLGRGVEGDRDIDVRALVGHDVDGGRVDRPVDAVEADGRRAFGAFGGFHDDGLAGGLEQECSRIRAHARLERGGDGRCALGFGGIDLIAGICRVAHAVGVVVGFARKILRADVRRIGARRKRVHGRIERIAFKACERDGGHGKRAFALGHFDDGVMRLDKVGGGFYVRAVHAQAMPRGSGHRAGVLQGNGVHASRSPLPFRV